MCRLAVVDTQLEQARVQVALAVAQHSLAVARHVQLDLVVAQYRLAVSQYRLADAQREWTVEELEQARPSSMLPTSRGRGGRGGSRGGRALMEAIPEQEAVDVVAQHRLAVSQYRLADAQRVLSHPPNAMSELSSERILR